MLIYVKENLSLGMNVKLRGPEKNLSGKWKLYNMQQRKYHDVWDSVVKKLKSFNIFFKKRNALVFFKNAITFSTKHWELKKN